MKVIYGVFKFVISKPFRYTSSFSVYLSITLSVVSERIHLENLIPRFCGSTVSLTGSISHAKITELPTWRGGRLWILPLSSWQHELGVRAAGLILDSEPRLTPVKRTGFQTIVFSGK